jgi:hypothetical protein
MHPMSTAACWRCFDLSHLRTSGRKDVSHMPASGHLLATNRSITTLPGSALPGCRLAEAPSPPASTSRSRRGNIGVEKVSCLRISGRGGRVRGEGQSAAPPRRRATSRGSPLERSQTRDQWVIKLNTPLPRLCAYEVSKRKALRINATMGVPGECCVWPLEGNKCMFTGPQRAPSTRTQYTA